MKGDEPSEIAGCQVVAIQYEKRVRELVCDLLYGSSGS